MLSPGEKHWKLTSSFPCPFTLLVAQPLGAKNKLVQHSYKKSALLNLGLQSWRVPGMAQMNSVEKSHWFTLGRVHCPRGSNDGLGGPRYGRAELAVGSSIHT